MVQSRRSPSPPPAGTGLRGSCANSPNSPLLGFCSCPCAPLGAAPTPREANTQPCAFLPLRHAPRSRFLQNWKLTQGEAGAASAWMQPLRAVAWRKDPGPRHLPTLPDPRGAECSFPQWSWWEWQVLSRTGDQAPFSRYWLRIVGASFQAPEQEEKLLGRASGGECWAGAWALLSTSLLRKLPGGCCKTQLGSGFCPAPQADGKRAGW